jgi:hypothetical protein
MEEFKKILKTGGLRTKNELMFLPLFFNYVISKGDQVVWNAILENEKICIKRLELYGTQLRLNILEMACLFSNLDAVKAIFESAN